MMLNHDQIRQLLRSLRRFESQNPPLIARNTAIIVLLVACGLRPDEIAGAVWMDLEALGSNQILLVPGKPALRDVKLPVMAIEAIERWKAHHPYPKDSEPLFTRVLSDGQVTTQMISVRDVRDIVMDAADDAGLPGVTPASLRRSFARSAWEAGVPLELIRRALGHQNVASTRRYVNAALDKGA